MSVFSPSKLHLEFDISSGISLRLSDAYFFLPNRRGSFPYPTAGKGHTMVPRGVSVLRKPISCTPPPPGFSCPGPRCPRSARCPHSPSVGSPTTTDRPLLGTPDNTCIPLQKIRAARDHTFSRQQQCQHGFCRTMKVSVQGGNPPVVIPKKFQYFWLFWRVFFCRREPQKLKSSRAKMPPGVFPWIPRCPFGSGFKHFRVFSPK